MVLVIIVVGEICYFLIFPQYLVMCCILKRLTFGLRIAALDPANRSSGWISNLLMIKFPKRLSGLRSVLFLAAKSTVKPRVLHKRILETNQLFLKSVQTAYGINPSALRMLT